MLYISFLFGRMIPGNQNGHILNNGNALELDHGGMGHFPAIVVRTRQLIVKTDVIPNNPEPFAWQLGLVDQNSMGSEEFLSMIRESLEPFQVV